MHAIGFWLRVAKRGVFQPVESLRAWRVIKSLSREIESSGIKVVFYDRLAVHTTFLAPVTRLLEQDDFPLAYVVADSTHPLVTSNRSTGHVYEMPRGFELFMRFISVPCIVTAASNVDVLCKNGATTWAHLFHSPVSVHYVYQDTALDAYDAFFCVGPHQMKEIECLRAVRGWKNVKMFEAGYPKLDEIVEKIKTHRVGIGDGTVRKIVFAPSWGANNILRSHGYEIVKGLLMAGFQVVLRPHKHSFDFDSDILDRICQDFGEHDFHVDDQPGFDTMVDSDLLISDWSGVAYEFAFSTGRPVVFVEVEGGRKVQSEKNSTIPLDAMEDVCRYEVGFVCGPDEVVDAVVKTSSISLKEWRERIGAVQGKYFYNFGSAARPVADKIVELAQSA